MCSRVRVPAEMGALLIEAIERARRAQGCDPDTAVGAEPLDALVVIAEASLATALRAGAGDVWQVRVHKTVSPDGAVAYHLERGGALAEETGERIA